MLLISLQLVDTIKYFVCHHVCLCVRVCMFGIICMHAFIVCLLR